MEQCRCSGRFRNVFFPRLVLLISCIDRESAELIFSNWVWVTIFSFKNSVTQAVVCFLAVDLLSYIFR